MGTRASSVVLYAQLVADRLQILPSWRTPLLAFALAAIALCAAAGGGWGVVALLLALVVLAWSARVVSSPEDRAWLVTLTLSALLVRAVLAALAQFWLGSTANSSLGVGTEIAPDARAYLYMAAQLAGGWHGLPVDPLFRDALSDINVVTNYVRVAAAIFWVTGDVPLVLRLFDTALGVATGLLLYRLMRNIRMPGGVWAALIVFVFPSLVLWPLFALKDPFVVFLMVAVGWSVTEFLRSRRYAWYLVTIAAALGLENVRRPLFVIMVAAWPVLLAVALRRGSRLRPFGVAAMAAVVLLASTPTASYFSPAILAAPAFVRSATAQGARTGFGEAAVTPPPAATPPAATATATTKPTETTAATIPGSTSEPASSPPPGASIAPSTAPAASPSSVPTLVATTAVPARATLPPTSAPQSLGDASDTVAFNLRHLPIGLAYLAGAPFPWQARTLVELSTIPEMLTWYLVIAFAALGTVAIMRRWSWSFIFPVFMAGALIGILSISEGNVGTLVRHRAMLVPWMAALAAAGIDHLIARRKRLRSSVADDSR